MHVYSCTESIPIKLSVGIVVFGDAHSATFILVAISLRIPSLFYGCAVTVLCEHSISECNVSDEQGMGGVDREDHVGRYGHEHEIILSRVAVSS